MQTMFRKRSALTSVVIATVGVGMLAGSALAYGFPSTNELNKAMQVPGREGQAAPYVEEISDGPGTLTLRFNNPAPGTARFEVQPRRRCEDKRYRTSRH